MTKYLIFAAGLVCSLGNAWADPPADMRAKFSTLSTALQNNPFHKPIVLNSRETPNRIEGDVYAVIPHEFAKVQTQLARPEAWCDIVSLHINTKYCRVMAGGPPEKLLVRMGKKTPEPLADATPFEFSFRASTDTPGYLSVVLHSQAGPISTSNYQLSLEATAGSGSQTLLHLHYGYTTSFASRFAMQAYLLTAGRHKVGFTPLQIEPPKAIGGARGAMERNTMRYYLAIQAYMDASTAAPNEQFERRLSNWFSAVEQFPEQLHELEQGEYLEMKREERARERNTP